MTDPTDEPVILILGGTAEAQALAQRLGARGGLAVATARDMGAHEGGALTAVVDARHPCATGISRAPVPILRLWRPEWRAGPGDDWVHVADGIEAARAVPDGATIFVATGRGRLPELSGLSGRSTVWWRRRGPADAPFPFDAGGWLTEEGPFTETRERALFRRLGIDWMILQNAGGEGAWPKLAAARALGVKVAMIARPPRPAPSVESVDEALAWVGEVLA